MEKAALKGMFASGTMPAGAEYKAALNDILQTFPYFQLAQVFFARNIYNAHEPEASGRIKLASVYAPDRKAMYLLFKKPDGEEKNLNDATSKESISDKTKEKVKYNFVYSSPQRDNISNTSIGKEPETKLTVQPPIKKIITVEPKKPEIKKIVVVEPLAPVETDMPLAENKKSQISEQLISGETIHPVQANEPISNSSLKFSFGSWLKVLPEISIEKKGAIKPASQKETSSIIETFIKKAPSISRPKTEFFSSVKAAKMSNLEDDSIVSETLAKIYFTQGNLPKALKAYESLLVQFPEKKNIFAPRIEEIKALMRENIKPGTK